MTLTVAIENSATVIAGLIREGVTFTARQSGATVVITFTGGF